MDFLFFFSYTSLYTDHLYTKFKKPHPLIYMGRSKKGPKLYKMNSYGIRETTLKWLSSFLKDRTMNAVVEGQQSKSVKVESGVPLGAVLGALMFSCHII